MEIFTLGFSSLFFIIIIVLYVQVMTGLHIKKVPYVFDPINWCALNELSSNFPMASRQLNMCKTIERKVSPLYLEVWNDNFLMVNRSCSFSLFENTLGQVGRRKHREGTTTCRQLYWL